MRKLKLLLASVALLFGGGISVWAQTDVTSTYLTNAGFDDCTAETSDVAAKTIKDYSSNGWTNANTGSFTTIAVTAYGGGKKVGGSTTPSTKKDGTTVSGKTLGIIAGWGDDVKIQSDNITLPAGSYTLTVDHYLTSSTSNYTTSRFGFVTASKSYLVSSTAFTESTWTTETVTFTLTESTTGKIQIGLLGNNNSGSGTPAVFYDDVTLTYKAVVVKVVLETALTAATNANTTLKNSDLTAAIATAQSVYENEDATQNEVNTAAENLTAAIALAMSAAGDVTAVLLSNPGFESCTVTTTNAAASGSAAPSDIKGDWTQVSSAAWSSSAVVAYGGEGQVNGVSAPSADNAGNSGNALGVSVGWGGTVTYQSAAVTLPAGAYILRVNAYNAHTKTQLKSHFGFVPTSGTSIISTKNSFTSNTWETDIVTFTLDEATEGKFQIGGQAISGGSGDNAKVFFDNITINYEAIIRPTDINLSETSLNLTTCGTATLTPVYTPNGANTDIDITWTTSDATVATVSAGVVTAVGPGTATITAKLTKDESKTATCDVTVTDVTPVTAPSFYSEIAAGDFYIVNAATGKYLGGANSWGTQASLIKHGIPFGVTVGENVYTLDTYTYEADNKHFLNGTYVDGESTNLYIKPLGDGKYSISTADGSSFLTANTNNTVVENTAPTANSVLAQWYFLSRDDMLKALNAATEGNPADATFFLTEADITRNLRKSRNNSGWKGTFSYGGNNENQCAESINKKHDVYQTVSVPNGNYIVKVQGFYRPGESAVNSYFYANDNSVPMNILNANGEGTAENMGGASTAFSAGQYQNELEVIVTDNKLTVGVKTEATDSWTIWDNFELYLKNTTGLNVSPVIADGDYYMTVDNGATFISRGQKGKEPTEASFSEDNEQLVTLKTDIAGITTITFKDTNKRLFWNEEKVYTDGTEHIQKNYHHPFWAVTKDGDNYQLRNIEAGGYLKVESDAATVDETGDNWVFDVPASSYTALNNAIKDAEAKTLGFEDGQYAPYNNVSVLNTLATAKAINQTVNNPSLKVSIISSVLTSSWTANVGDVDIIYNGNFAEANGTNPKGWTRSNGAWGQQITGLTAAENNVDAETTTAWYYNTNGAWEYGKDNVYKMPLAASQAYKLTFKYRSHESNSNNNMKASVLNDSSEGLAKVTFAKNGDATKFVTATAYFTTGAAGNYILSLTQSGNTHLTDVSLVKVASTTKNISEEATAVASENQTYYETVSLTRTLSASYWNSFSVPFDAAIPSGWEVKEFASATDNVITFTDATSFEAGKPYLVKPDADAVNPTFNGVIVENTSGETEGTGDYKFAAQIYNKALATDGTIAYLATDGSIKKLTSGSIKGLRAYFIIPASGAPARLSFGDDETTGISTMHNAQFIMHNELFDLQGRKVTKPAKGLYIKNGKKVVMK